MFHIPISCTHLPDRSGIQRTIEVEFLDQILCLLVEPVVLVLILEENYATTVLGLVKIGNDDTGAIAVVLVLLDMLILLGLLLLLELAAQVLVLDTIDLIAGDDDDQAAGDELELGKE